ncbi:hypothetical protein HOLleu_22790 [Holothuria leucospilota]|uniref:Uncharacterized protein n=1 Tax=Holothuria leucospilota TaxID=206669 RepID=A0A9Q1BU72_HOLLE|nr:hypothetical protein HOLleu_22790 [Holothuria leucospilota]
MWMFYGKRKLPIVLRWRSEVIWGHLGTNSEYLVYKISQVRKLGYFTWFHMVMQLIHQKTPLSFLDVSLKIAMIQRRLEIRWNNHIPNRKNSQESSRSNMNTKLTFQHSKVTIIQ